MSLFRPRAPRESQHETSELMMPQDANVLGHVFGGVILSMMDKAAAVAAFRHARSSCVTVSIDRVDFREPIHVGDLVVMKASVNYVGRTSMEVGVRVEAEELTTGRRRHTNSCYLTFVAVDRNGRPLEVPPLAPETPDERRRHEAAAARRRRRLEERASEERTLDAQHAAAAPGAPAAAPHPAAAPADGAGPAPATPERTPTRTS
jgi:acyl-CoA hydrolase